MIINIDCVNIAGSILCRSHHWLPSSDASWLVQTRLWWHKICWWSLFCNDCLWVPQLPTLADKKVSTIIFIVYLTLSSISSIQPKHIVNKRLFLRRMYFRYLEKGGKIIKKRIQSFDEVWFLNWNFFIMIEIIPYLNIRQLELITIIPLFSAQQFAINWQNFVSMT